ncbi:SMP-30/gluconolactonase/LRE family protein [Niabella beijingensis]|uniref:SMP-30/gluconolactonase/LRE family protein n=1 Tax=Niabella beijingensis TaxID=2872700 RepID=UPI001CBB14F9|nr:ATP-binding protein [Niabella beijingensis]MBZ4189114.1 ATP-binding protein [Niabella beijingensis]
MKKNWLLLSIFISGIATAQVPRLEKLWETDTIIPIPESVLPDVKAKVLYVSLINGGGWDEDGKGGVGRLSPDGKQFDSTWIEGLDAPKGLGRVGNKLFVADISAVVVIDIPTGTIEKKIHIDGATGLNDIATDARGAVFVADSRKARIWKLEGERPTLYLDSIKGANGLKVIGPDLYFAEGKKLKKINGRKEVTLVAVLPQGIDGIEPAGNGDLIVTAWSGYIFYVTASGKISLLLDTHAEKMNTADIGYDPGKNILYVPTFNARKVVAYQLVRE